MLPSRHQWLKIKRLLVCILFLYSFRDFVSLVHLDSSIWMYIFDYVYVIDFWFQANESSQWSSYWKTMAKSRNVITRDQPRVCSRCIPFILDFFLFIVFLFFIFQILLHATLFIKVSNINKKQRLYREILLSQIHLSSWWSHVNIWNKT